MSSRTRWDVVQDPGQLGCNMTSALRFTLRLKPTAIAAAPAYLPGVSLRPQLPSQCSIATNFRFSVEAPVKDFNASGR